MSQRVAHHQNRIVTGLLIATLLVIVIASIPAVAVAGMSAMQSQYRNTAITEQTGDAMMMETGGMSGSDMGGMGQFCPMMFGCNMMSSVGHCAPTVLISDVPVCERAVSYTVAVSVTEAPLHPAQISTFHFRPPIL